MNENPDVPAEMDGPDVHHTSHDPDEHGSLSTTVIEAVAAVAGIDPSRTRIPIDRSINPDALDKLFERRGDEAEEGACLVFPVWEYTVVVHADGHVFVHDDDATRYEE